MKTAVATLIVLVLAFAALAVFSNGFRTWTREQARRFDIAERQPQVPDIAVIDETGAMHSLGSWIKASGKATLIEFIYTRCSAVCRTLGSENQKLQALIQKTGLEDHAQLLSISFDPRHDSPAILADYARKQNTDPAIWRFSTVSRQDQLSALLNFFGVTVIADEFGGFQHNAALLWVGTDGRLLRAVDYDDEQIRTWLNSPAAQP